jgi:DNA-binding MurR/RpiR family transcriptional regulator
MSTPEATAVNAAPPRAVMLSIADLAKREGVSKAAVSRKVKRLRPNGLQVELDEQQRVALVNSVQYDQLRGRFADPSKAQAPLQRELPEPQSETYEEARRQLTWVEAERAKLKLEAEQKLYVRVEELEVAVDRVSERIVETVDQLLQAADDLSAAVARDGVHGLRAALKKLAFEMKTDIADSLAALAKGAQQ